MAWHPPRSAHSRQGVSALPCAFTGQSTPWPPICEAFKAWSQRRRPRNARRSPTPPRACSALLQAHPGTLHRRLQHPVSPHVARGAGRRQPWSRRRPARARRGAAAVCGAAAGRVRGVGPHPGPAGRGAAAGAQRQHPRGHCRPASARGGWWHGRAQAPRLRSACACRQHPHAALECMRGALWQPAHAAPRCPAAAQGHFVAHLPAAAPGERLAALLWAPPGCRRLLLAVTARGRVYCWGMEDPAVAGGGNGSPPQVACINQWWGRPACDLPLPPPHAAGAAGGSGGAPQAAQAAAHPILLCCRLLEPPAAAAWDVGAAPPFADRCGRCRGYTPRVGARAGW